MGDENKTFLKLCSAVKEVSDVDVNDVTISCDGFGRDVDIENDAVENFLDLQEISLHSTTMSPSSAQFHFLVHGPDNIESYMSNIGIYNNIDTKITVDGENFYGKNCDYRTVGVMDSDNGWILMAYMMTRNFYSSGGGGMTDELRWRCEECDTVNTATNRRHSMDYCDGCGDTWVDYEVAYSRCSIGVEYLE